MPITLGLFVFIVLMLVLLAITAMFVAEIAEVNISIKRYPMLIVHYKKTRKNLIIVSAGLLTLMSAILIIRKLLFDTDWNNNVLMPILSIMGVLLLIYGLSLLLPSKKLKPGTH